MLRSMSLGGINSYQSTMVFHSCCMKNGACLLKSVQVILVYIDVEISGSGFLLNSSFYVFHFDFRGKLFLFSPLAKCDCHES